MSETSCRVLKVVEAAVTSDGAGVSLRRTIGTAALRNLDPFLMLDHFSSDNPNDYIAGFPDHPHRGFVTFTYMINGHMRHRDSMGNSGELRSGAAQWMKAASGVIHSEMPVQKEGLMRGFQLWINLPATQKMSRPEYQEFPPEAFATIEREGYTAKILVGEFAGARGVIKDPTTDATYLDVTLKKGEKFSAAISSGYVCFVCPFEGAVEVGGTRVSRHALAVVDVGGGAVEVLAPDADARFVLASGKPIGEPIVQHGPFVMNSRAEIEQAFSDYQNGTLVLKN